MNFSTLLKKPPTIGVSRISANASPICVASISLPCSMSAAMKRIGTMMALNEPFFIPLKPSMNCLPISEKAFPGFFQKESTLSSIVGSFSTSTKNFSSSSSFLRCSVLSFSWSLFPSFSKTSTCKPLIVFSKFFRSAIAISFASFFAKSRFFATFSCSALNSSLKSSVCSVLLRIFGTISFGICVFGICLLPLYYTTKLTSKESLFFRRNQHFPLSPHQTFSAFSRLLPLPIPCQIPNKPQRNGQRRNHSTKHGANKSRSFFSFFMPNSIMQHSCSIRCCSCSSHLPPNRPCNQTSRQCSKPKIGRPSYCGCGNSTRKSSSTEHFTRYFLRRKWVSGFSFRCPFHHGR